MDGVARVAGLRDPGVGLMAGAVFIALSIPQFGKILSLIGGSSITLMTFVLPPLFYLKLVSQQDLNKEWPKRLYKLKFLGLNCF